MAPFTVKTVIADEQTARLDEFYAGHESSRDKLPGYDG